MIKIFLSWNRWEIQRSVLQPHWMSSVSRHVEQMFCPDWKLWIPQSKKDVALEGLSTCFQVIVYLMKLDIHVWHWHEVYLTQLSGLCFDSLALTWQTSSIYVNFNKPLFRAVSSAYKPAALLYSGSGRLQNHIMTPQHPRRLLLWELLFVDWE